MIRFTEANAYCCSLALRFEIDILMEEMISNATYQDTFALFPMVNELVTLMVFSL